MVRFTKTYTIGGFVIRTSAFLQNGEISYDVQSNKLDPETHFIVQKQLREDAKDFFKNMENE